MRIVFNQEKIPGQTIVDKMTKAAEECLAAEGVDSSKAEVSLTFVDRCEIKEINRIYRDNNEVTDVLSFPQFSDFDKINSYEEIVLGDVVICTEQALLQADDFGHSSERELVYLFVHSMFHLLGYDHMDKEEKTVMREKEEDIMEKLGIER